MNSQIGSAFSGFELGTCSVKFRAPILNSLALSNCGSALPSTSVDRGAGFSRPRLGNGIGLKREEAVIVGAGARHLIWHSRRKSRGCVCTISQWRGGDGERHRPSLSLTSPGAPRRHAASTGGGGEAASKLRNPPPPAGRLEFTPQAGQPNGNKKLRQTALPTPRRPGNIAPTTPVLGATGFAADGAGRLASPRLASSRFQRDASVDTSAGHIEGRQGSPRVALSDANCLCSNCLRVTPLEQSPNCCSVLGDIYSMEILAMEKNAPQMFEVVGQIR